MKHSKIWILVGWTELWGCFALFLGCFWAFFVAELEHGPRGTQRQPWSDPEWWRGSPVTRSFSGVLAILRGLWQIDPSILVKFRGLSSFCPLSCPKGLEQGSPISLINLEQIWIGFILNHQTLEPNIGHPSLAQTRTRWGGHHYCQESGLHLPLLPLKASLMLLAKYPQVFPFPPWGKAT